MTIEDILNIDIEEKNLLIIGCPASGKTYLSKKFKTSHKLIHTDNYLNYGYEQSVYKIIDDIKNSNKKTIVEGVQGYRLLRKGVQLDCYYPDVVIELIISEYQMFQVYRNERNQKKIKYLKAFNNMHNKIIKDYFLMQNKYKPEWFKIYK